DAPYRRTAVAQNLVGALGYCVGRVGVGGAAVGRGVLEAAVVRRGVGRGHPHPRGPAGRGGPGGGGRGAGVQLPGRGSGAGVRQAAESIMATTSLAASTSSADTQAGSERPCVSRPMNNGPLVPCAARYSTMAWVIARMWASLNAPPSADPRWPDVPNATC